MPNSHEFIIDVNRLLAKLEESGDLAAGIDIANRIVKILGSEEVTQPDLVIDEHVLQLPNAERYDHWFQNHGDMFWEAAFTLSAQSNRMGCRLQGPAIERDAGAPASIVSEPVAAGNIQVPADGQPIIVLREQTIGGYTAIATIIAADLWRVGQAKPGDTVTFIQVPLEEGQRIGRVWRKFLADTGRLLTSNPPHNY